jgi:RNA polymerase sigma factor (TIGR02999 family)
MQHERSGQSLDATALVHDAYLRPVGDQKFANRGHFFAAAAQAMQRILIEKALRGQRLRHGGGRKHVELRDEEQPDMQEDDELLALDEAFTKIAGVRPQVAVLVQLRFFGGLTVEEAHIFGGARCTVKRLWVFARAWLRNEMGAAFEP